MRGKFVTFLAPTSFSYEDGGDHGAHARPLKNQVRTPNAKRRSPVLSTARPRAGSKITIRQYPGSKNRRCTAVAPAPGPPCRNSTGAPRGVPDCSQYIV